MYILNYFIPRTSPAPIKDDEETPKWLYNAQQILFREGLDIHFLRHIQRKIIEAKISNTHPIVSKIQEVLSRYRFLETSTLLKDTPQHLNAQNLPIINGDVLDVQCTLAAIKLIIKKEGDKFKTIILHDFDDEVASIIAGYCPNVESLQLRAGFGASQSFSDEGLGSIAKLKKLQELVIIAPLAIQITSKGFEILLNTPALQTGLASLTLNTYGPDDKELNLLTNFKSLTSLNLFSHDSTTQGLLSLLQSSNLKTSLKQLRFVIKYSKAIVNDLILMELSKYENLQSIHLDSKWQITDPAFIKFLNAQKKLPSLSLKGLALSADCAAKIGEMSSLTKLKLNDCSVLKDENFLSLLNNKSQLTQLNLSKANELWGTPLKHLSQFLNLTVFHLSGSQWYSWLNNFDDLCNASEMQQHLKELYVSNIHSLCENPNSFGSIEKLQALTSLRIDNCPSFNDDSIRSIFAHSQKNQIITAQFKNVSITSNSFEYLNESIHLKKLMIANCSAIDVVGREQFFNFQGFQKNLTTLFLNNFSIPIRDPLINKLAKFSSLTRLGITNNDCYMDLIKLEDLKKNSGGRLDLIYWMGPDNDGTLYRLFKGDPV